MAGTTCNVWLVVGVVAVVAEGGCTARGAGSADDKPVLVVGEVLDWGLARGASAAPVLAVGGVREVAYLAARTAEAAVKPLVRPAVAVEPLGDSVACSTS